VTKAEALDIEEKTVDFGPRFFCPRFTLEQARQKTIDFLSEFAEEYEYHDWPKRCRRGSYVSLIEDSPGPYDPEERHPLCHAQGDAERRLDWFLTAMGSDW
jgi:hypothetical protein